MASDAAVDLLKSLLVFDPSNRLTAAAALKHSYFVNMYCIFFLQFIKHTTPMGFIGTRLWKVEQSTGLILKTSFCLNL